MVNRFVTARAIWRIALIVLLALLLTAGASLSPSALFFTETPLLHSCSLPPFARSIDTVVVVNIDERSLDAYGNWPWKRSLIARLVDSLTSAESTSVGIAILFAERTPDDDQLRASLRKHPHAVIGYYRSSTLPFIAADASRSMNLGQVGFIFDRAGNAIGVAPSVNDGGVVIKALPVALAERVNPLASTKAQASDVLRFNFCGARLPVTQISAIDILKSSVKDQVRGKTVIIDAPIAPISLRTSIGRVSHGAAYAILFHNILNQNWLQFSPILNFAVLVLFGVAALSIPRKGFGLPVLFGLYIVTYLVVFLPLGYVLSSLSLIVVLAVGFLLSPAPNGGSDSNQRG